MGVETTRWSRVTLRGHEIGLSVVSGALLIAPFLWDGLFFTAWFALVPLLLVIEGKSRMRAAGLSLVAGFVAHLLGIYWLVNTMVRFGELPFVSSVGLYLVICLGFGFMFVPFGVMFAWVGRRCGSGTLRQAVFIASLFTASEYLFPHVFPWRLGYSQIALLPVVQIADLTGAYGVSFLLALANATVYQLIRMRQRAEALRWPTAALTVTLLSVSVVYGFWRLAGVRAEVEAAPVVRVALLQPNVGFTEKYDERFANQQHERLLSLTRSAVDQRADFIIWPESSYRNLIRVEQERISVIVAAPPTTYLYIGANTYSDQQGRTEDFNSALLLSPNGEILGRYDKHVLFPFGEYVPFGEVFPFLKGIAAGIGDLTHGYGPIVQEIPGGLMVGPLICYEDVLPSLSRNAVRAGARMLVNITNDVWFGDTIAPHQHYTLSRFRAIENRVPLVRATNTGLTSVTFPTGELVSAADTFVETVLIQDIPVLDSRTLYTTYGDIFAMLCVILAVVAPVKDGRGAKLFVRRIRSSKP